MPSCSHPTKNAAMDKLNLRVLIGFSPYLFMNAINKIVIVQTQR